MLLDRELAFMVERTDPREPGTAKFKDPGTFRQKLDRNFLPRIEIASDLQVGNRKDMSRAVAANGDFDQRRPPFPVYRDHGGLTTMVPGDHRKGKPFRFCRDTGWRGDLRENSGATRYGDDRKRQGPHPHSLNEPADWKPFYASHLPHITTGLQRFSSAAMNETSQNRGKLL